VRVLTETSLFAMNVRKIIVLLGDWEKNPEALSAFADGSTL
jgi:hypothetical protein